MVRAFGRAALYSTSDHSETLDRSGTRLIGRLDLVGRPW